MQKQHIGGLRTQLERVKNENELLIEQEYDRFANIQMQMPMPIQTPIPMRTQMLAGNQPPNIPDGFIGRVVDRNDGYNVARPQQQQQQEIINQQPIIAGPNHLKVHDFSCTNAFGLFDRHLREELNNDFGKVNAEPIVNLLEGFIETETQTKAILEAVEELVYSVDKKRFKPQYVVDMKEFMMEFIDRLKNEFEQMANDMQRIYEDYKLKPSECHSKNGFPGHQHNRPLVYFDIYATVTENDKKDGYRAFRQMLYAQRGVNKLSPATFIADLITEKLYTKPSADSFRPIAISKDLTTTSQIVFLQTDAQKRLTVVLESMSASREKKRISVLRTKPDPSLELTYDLPYFTENEVPQMISRMEQQNITLVNSFEVKAKDTCKYFLNKNWILSSSSNKLNVTITYSLVRGDRIENIPQKVDWQRQVDDKDATVELIFFDQEYAETTSNFVKDEPVCCFGVVTNRKNVIIFKAQVNTEDRKVTCSSICTSKIELTGANRIFRLHGMLLDMKKQSLVAFTTFDADRIEPLEEKVYRFSDFQDFAVPIIEDEDIKGIEEPIPKHCVLLIFGYILERKQGNQFFMKPTARLAVPISCPKDAHLGELKAILKQDYMRAKVTGERNARPSDWMWIGIENSFELFQIEVKVTEKVSARDMFDGSDDEGTADQQVDLFLGPKAYRCPIPIKMLKMVNRVAIVDNQLIQDMAASLEKHKQEEKKRRDKLEKNPTLKLTEAEKQQLSTKEYELKALAMWNAAKESNPIGDIMIADEYYRMVFIENAGPYDGNTTIKDTTTVTGGAGDQPVAADN